MGSHREQFRTCAAMLAHEQERAVKEEVVIGGGWEGGRQQTRYLGD